MTTATQVAPRSAADGSAKPDAKANHLQRRSSLQKIMHICNQGYSAVPHMLIRLQDVQMTISFDVKNLILALKPNLLSVGVTLAAVTLIIQFFICCAIACTFSFSNGPQFLMGCIFILGCFTYVCLATPVAKPVQRSLSWKICRSKMD